MKKIVALAITILCACGTSSPTTSVHDAGYGSGSQHEPHGVQKDGGVDQPKDGGVDLPKHASQFTPPGLANVYHDTTLVGNGTPASNLGINTAAFPSGTGTTNAVTKWTGTNTVGSSSIIDNASTVSTTEPVAVSSGNGGADTVSGILALPATNALGNVGTVRLGGVRTDITGIFNAVQIRPVMGAGYISGLTIDTYNSAGSAISTNLMSFAPITGATTITNNTTLGTGSSNNHLFNGQVTFTGTVGNNGSVINYNGDGLQSTYIRGGLAGGHIYIGDINTGSVFLGAASNPTVIQGSAYGSGDNTYFGWDAQSAARVGFVKKAGSLGQIAFGSAQTFVIASSSTADISTPGTSTFTDRLDINTTGTTLTPNGGYTAISSSNPTLFNCNANLGCTGGDTGVQSTFIRAGDSAGRIVIGDANSGGVVIGSSAGGAVSTEVVNSLGHTLAVFGLYQSNTVQDIGDSWNARRLTKNWATNSDALGPGTASCSLGYGGGWSTCNYGGQTFTYSVVSDVSPRGVWESVGRIDAAVNVAGSDYRFYTHGNQTGYGDLRGRTFTFSFWVKAASGTSLPAGRVIFTVGRNNFAGGQSYPGSCPQIFSATWTRCWVTGTFTNTDLGDNSDVEADIYGIQASDGGIKLADAQLEINTSVPSPYTTSDNVGVIDGAQAHTLINGRILIYAVQASANGNTYTVSFLNDGVTTGSITGPATTPTIHYSATTTVTNACALLNAAYFTCSSQSAMTDTVTSDVVSGTTYTFKGGEDSTEMWSRRAAWGSSGFNYVSINQWDSSHSNARAALQIDGATAGCVNSSSSPTYPLPDPGGGDYPYPTMGLNLNGSAIIQTGTCTNGSVQNVFTFATTFNNAVSISNLTSLDTPLYIVNSNTGGRQFMIETSATGGVDAGVLAIHDNTGATTRAIFAPTATTINNLSTDTLTLHGATSIDGGLTSTAGDSTFGRLNGTRITATLSASVNDWAPTGIGTATILDITSATNTWNITGISSASSVTGRFLLLVNNGGNFITISHNSASSLAANRISTIAAATRTLYAGSGYPASMLLYFNGTNWEEVSEATWFVPTLHISTGGFAVDGGGVSLTTATTISGTTNATPLAITNTATGQTTAFNGVNVSLTGSSNTTAGVITNGAVAASNTMTRSAGANNLTNVGLYGNASGAQINVALRTDNGDVQLNNLSGSTSINGATTLNAHLITKTQNVTLTNATCASTVCTNIAGTITTTSTAPSITFTTFTGAKDANCAITPIGTAAAPSAIAHTATSLSWTATNTADYSYVCVSTGT